MAEANSGGPTGGGPSTPPTRAPSADVKSDEQRSNEDGPTAVYEVTARAITSQHPGFDEAVREGLRRGSFERLDLKRGDTAENLISTDWRNDGSTPVRQFKDAEVEEAFKRLNREETERLKQDGAELKDASSAAVAEPSAAEQASQRNQATIDSSSQPTERKDEAQRPARAKPLANGAGGAQDTPEGPVIDGDKVSETNAERAQRFLKQQDPLISRDSDLSREQTYVDVAGKIARERWPGNERRQNAYIQGATRQVAKLIREGEELGGIAYRNGEVVSLRPQQQQTRDQSENQERSQTQSQSQQPNATPGDEAQKRQIVQRTLQDDTPKLRR